MAPRRAGLVLRLWGLGCPALLGCCSAAAAVPEERLPDAQTDGVEAVKAWAKRRVLLGEQRFAASGLPRQPSPSSWAGTVIYQVQVDRFNNGNVSNDYLHLPRGADQVERAAAGDIEGVPDWRHGGDLQGIRDRFGYLQDLGVQTLWITPVLMHDGWYHGYCLTDPTTTDPAFGTPEEMRDFVADAHRHGLSVVLDVVTNHMCDVSGLTSYTGALHKDACAKELNDAYWEGRHASNASQAGMNFSAEFFPPFRTEAFFSRCGPNALSDTTGLGPSAIFGDFVLGMFDFNTMNYDFQEIYTDIHKYWLAYADVDGLRLDAVKHVTTDFLAYFSTEIRAYARTIGKKNFLIIGEEAAEDEKWKAMSYGRMMSNPTDPEEHGKVPKALTKRLLGLAPQYLADPLFPAPGMTALYNFNVSEYARDSLRCQGKTTSLKDAFESDARRLLMQQSVPQKGAEPDAHLWMPLDLHDWPRFLNLQPHRLRLLKTAMAWHLTAPGSPIIYYGIEQGFNGRCGNLSVGNARSKGAIQAICASAMTEGEFGVHPDGLKRQDMFISGPWRLGSAVQEVDRLSMVTNTTPAISKPWQDDEMLQRNHSLYRLTRKLVALRRTCPALSAGTIQWHAAAAVKCGFLAYSRHPHAGTGAEVLMLINPGGGGLVEDSSLHLTASNAWQDGQLYVNVLNISQTAQVRALENGVTAFVPHEKQMEVGEIRAFVRKDQVDKFDEGLGIALCRPSKSEAVEEGGRRLLAPIWT